ncbi:hypothetical protein B0H11DRAFT_2250590 [Mycena galericulata]|nr:hypothetical protein B0H11DRAFT_2250590 [Mycena galericulata]
MSTSSVKGVDDGAERGYRGECEWGATIDAEYFFASIFFIICIVVLNFWIINLFVAVITNTFGVIRAQTKPRAYGAGAGVTPTMDPDDDGWASSPTSTIAAGPALPPRPNPAVFWLTRWLFIALTLNSLALWAACTPEITAPLRCEILLRMAPALPNWRNFLGFGAYKHVGSVVAGKEGGMWKGKDGWGAGQNWLDLRLAVATSLMRFYRVILVVPWMKPLLFAVFENMYGFVNMTLFLIIVNFIATPLPCCSYVRRPSLDPDNELRDFVLGVFSSENRTNVLYDTAQAESPFGQGILTVLFMIMAGWLIMFTAVINKSLDVAEEAKKEVGDVVLGPADAAGGPHAVTPSAQNRTGGSARPIEKGLVQGYNVPRPDGQSVFERDSDPQDEETERHLELIAMVRNEMQGPSRETNDAMYERRTQKADFLQDLAAVVPETCTARGRRAHLLHAAEPGALPLFQLTALLVVVESIAHPIYRRNYFKAHGLVRVRSSTSPESAFGLVFFVKFLVKIVADEFLFTPTRLS